jgi:hypothetical protein
MPATISPMIDPRRNFWNKLVETTSTARRITSAIRKE